MSIVAAYLVYAPKFHRLSRQHGYITIGDYIQQRFGSTTLTALSTVIFIVVLGNYILSNLKAIGYIVEVSTGGYVTFVQGVIVLSIIMLIYETLGGLRSVAWTDAIQGVLLLAGCVFYLWRNQLSIRWITRHCGDTNGDATRFLAATIGAAKTHVAEHTDDCIFSDHQSTHMPPNASMQRRTNRHCGVPSRSWSSCQFLPPSSCLSSV